MALRRALALLALLLWGLPPGRAMAYAPAGYPGASWGSLTRGDGDTEGTGAQGWVRQGVRWARFKGGVDLDTYAAYNWRVRTENKTYYNTYGPSLIAAFERSPFSAGAEFAWLRYPDQPLDSRNYSLFASWFASRDVSRWTGMPSLGSHAPLALPLSLWGKMSHDLHGPEGSGSMGWVKQGVEWFSLGRGVRFVTVASYNWRLRTKNNKYYDVYGPSVGLLLKARTFDLGTEWHWQKFPQLYRTARIFNISLGWYYGWDMKRK